MKTVEPVHIPLAILVTGLRESVPGYIKLKGGVRINLYDLAAHVIETLVFQAEKSEAQMHELERIIDDFLPALFCLTDKKAFSRTHCCSQEPDKENQPATADDSVPVARVVAALVVQEGA